MKMNEIINDVIGISHFFGNGIDQTTMLTWLALLDTIFGISHRIKDNIPLLSHNFFSGVIRNFTPTIFPALITMVIEPKFNRPEEGYTFVSTILFILIGYFLLQSIVANMILCGFILPKKLKRWLGNWTSYEIEIKKGRKHE